MHGLFYISYGLLWTLVIVQTYVLVEVLRQIGLVRVRIGPDPAALLVDDGLERGELMPEVSGKDLTTGLVVRSKTWLGRRTLLVFVTPRCQSCLDLLEQLPPFARTFSQDARIIAICSGPETECRQIIGDVSGPLTVVSDPSQDIMRDFQVKRTPAATLVDEHGRVLIHGIPNDWRQLEGLLDEEGAASGVAEDWIETLR